MKMEESVYSCKQLSVKDGEVIYSLYEEQYSPPPLIATALTKSLHTWGEWFRSKASGNLLDVALKWKSRKAQFYIICVCAHVRVCVVDAFLV